MPGQSIFEASTDEEDVAIEDNDNDDVRIETLLRRSISKLSDMEVKAAEQALIASQTEEMRVYPSLNNLDILSSTVSSQ